MKSAEGHGDDAPAHFTNFIDAVRSRKQQDLNCDVAVGAESAMLVHLANISYRLGRRLKFDPQKTGVRGRRRGGVDEDAASVPRSVRCELDHAANH